MGNRLSGSSGVTIITSQTCAARVVHVCEAAGAGAMQAMSANGIVCVCVYWDEKEKQWKRAAVQMPVD